MSPCNSNPSNRQSGKRNFLQKTMPSATASHGDHENCVQKNLHNDRCSNQHKKPAKTFPVVAVRVKFELFLILMISVHFGSKVRENIYFSKNKKGLFGTEKNSRLQVCHLKILSYFCRGLCYGRVD